MKLLVFAVLAGCLPSSSVVCGDGRICPDDQVCAHVTDPDQDLCADPAQLDACAARPRYAHCGVNGRCYDGVCLAVACGDGRVDRADASDSLDQGEVCDDGNQRSGDGCSSDCRSDETCGNGVIDPIALERCDDGGRISNDGCDSVCQPETARWHRIRLDPNQRLAPAFAYDLYRDRLVMFGGLDANHLPLDETWEGTPSGFERVEPLQSPSPRGGAAMVYDLARRQVVLFGGEVSGQTWVWNGTSWSEPLVLDGPSPRHGHAMAYDARRARTVLFGGQTTSSRGQNNETWEWDGEVWTERTPATVPPAREGHGMAYDPRRGVVVMWGAKLDSSVWEYDGIDWREVRATGLWPQIRAHPSMAWDPITQRVIVVGGDLDGDELGDAWSWDGATWRSLGQLDPAIDAGHVMATNLRHGQVVVFGVVAAGLAKGEVATWTWDGAAWTFRAVVTSGDPIATGAARDSLRGRIVVVGSQGTASFDGIGWASQAHDPNDGRKLSAIAYDAGRRITILFGGINAARETFGDTWALQAASGRDEWVELRPSTPPPPRASAAMGFDVESDRIVMFGGAVCPTSDCDVLADTWEWNGVDWALAHPAHQPPARGHAAFAYDPIHQELVMFGGATPAVLGDTWTWDGADWTERHPATSPSARGDAAMAWDASRRRLVLFGGTSATSFANDDVWEWDGTTWTRAAVVDSPIRTQHAMASANGAGLVSFGGATAPGQPTSEVDALRWEGSGPAEPCRSDVDEDGDGLAGCADPDCWWVCAPLCPPGAPCDPAAPHCGDGACNPALEDGWICPADCARPTICGDGLCDPGETACPGDCP